MDNKRYGVPKVHDHAPKHNHGVVVLPEKPPIAWEEIGREIMFTSRDSARPLSYGEFKAHLHLSDQDELTLMNQLLAQHRPHGFPDGGKYYTASAGVTDTNQLFIDVTNQLYIVDPFAGRGCAETNMLGKTQQALSSTDVQFKAVYLMAAISTKQPDGTLKDVEDQPLGCLCGECRQNLRNHTKNARFIMIPANDGTLDVTLDHNPDGPSSKNAAWELNHSTMFPRKEYVELDDSSKAVIQSGYEYITQASVQALPLDTALTQALQDAPADGDSVILPKAIRDILLRRESFVTQSLPQLEGNPCIENINRAMLQLMKEAHAEHAGRISDTNNAEITVVLIKNKKGQFFSATLVDGKDWLPAKPAAAPTALSNAYNQKGFEEVYVMTFNDKRLREEMSGKTPHKLKRPDPAALNRIIKNLHAGDDAKLTIIHVNDGTLTEEKLTAMAVTDSVREAFGPNYVNPKMAKDLETPKLH